MRAWILCYFLAACSAYTSSGALGVVNDDTFKAAVVDAGKWVFVDFYADWCRHCQKLTPEIERVAEAFADYTDVFLAVKINGDTDGKRMLKKYVLVGYPTMLMFHGRDEPIEYNGSRDWKSISNFVQQLTGVRLEKDGGAAVADSVVVEETAQPRVYIHEWNATNFDDTVLGPASQQSVVLFSASWCHACSDFQHVYEALAHDVYGGDRDVRFGKVSLDADGNGDLADRYGVKTLPSIRFVKEGSVTAYTGKRDIGTLINTINRQFGLHRGRDGTLLASAGRLEHLDGAVADAFAEGATVEAAGASIVEACAATPPAHPPLLEYYWQLGHMLRLGEGHLLRVELARINAILDTHHHKLDSDVVDSMYHRRNILTEFTKHF